MVEQQDRAIAIESLQPRQRVCPEKGLKLDLNKLSVCRFFVRSVISWIAGFA
jgi:hypothetical protein